MVLNDTTLPKDSTLPDENDCYDEEIEHTAKQLFTVSHLGRTTTTSKRVDYLCCYTIWMFRSYIIYMPVFR